MLSRSVRGGEKKDRIKEMERPMQYEGRVQSHGLRSEQAIRKPKRERTKLPRESTIVKRQKLKGRGETGRGMYVSCPLRLGVGYCYTPVTKAPDPAGRKKGFFWLSFRSSSGKVWKNWFQML